MGKKIFTILFATMMVIAICSSCGNDDETKNDIRRRTSGSTDRPTDSKYRSNVCGQKERRVLLACQLEG